MLRGSSPRLIQIHRRSSLDSDDVVEPDDPFSSDEFRMYGFKVRRCARGRAHDWTDCPYAHPGEKARRRDPRKLHYAGTPCPEFKKEGRCDKGDGCEFAHGVFECWLHPMRYRTQACKDGMDCRRRVCFFAHTPEQLRVVSPRNSSVDTYDVSQKRMMKDGVGVGGTLLMDLSPKSILAPWTEYEVSPPATPNASTLAMMLRTMSLCGRGNDINGSFGLSGLPTTTPKVIERENQESFDGLDVGWISELVK